jgi:hypothetical protein
MGGDTSDIFVQVRANLIYDLKPKDLFAYMAYVLKDFELVLECSGRVYWQNEDRVPNYLTRWYEWDGWVVDCGTGAFKDIPQIVRKDNGFVRYVADEVYFPTLPSEEFLLKVKTKSLYGVQTKRLSGGNFA